MQLAHYRLGEIQTAEEKLEDAIDALPLIPDYLVKPRIAQPKLGPHGITIGGKDQAWLYRSEMRQTWKQTSSCLEWLKKNIVIQLILGKTETKAFNIRLFVYIDIIRNRV